MNEKRHSNKVYSPCFFRIILMKLFLLIFDDSSLKLIQSTVPFLSLLRRLLSFERKLFNLRLNLRWDKLWKNSDKIFSLSMNTTSPQFDRLFIACTLHWYCFIVISLLLLFVHLRLPVHFKLNSLQAD